MPPELLAQFGLVEDALRALGVVVWPMVEFEADDALAAAAAASPTHPDVERVVILSPDKDMAQCVREDGRVADLRPARRALHRRGRGRGQVRRERRLRSPTTSRSWATAPTATRACPAGAPGRRPPCCSATRTSRTSPTRSPRGTCRARRRRAWRATLRERRDEALLYRELATLRARRADPAAGPRRAALAGADGDRPSRPWPSGCARRASWSGSRPPEAGDPGVDYPRGCCASISRYVAWCRGMAATMPIELLGMPRSNQRLPRREVTSAPPSMAMTPGRADVPRGEALPLHVGVEAAVGHVGQAQRRAAHLARDAHGPPIARVLPREAGARQAQVHDGIADALLAGIADGLPVEEGAAAGDGVEELVADGIEDDAEARLAVDDEADADREERQAVGVVDGPVERVDDPQPVGDLTGGAGFLGQEAVGGEGRPDRSRGWPPRSGGRPR